MRCYNFWSSIAGDDGLKILMLQDGFPPIREQFLKALLGHVPDNFKLGNSRHQEIGPVPTAAIMSLEPDFDNYREYRQKIKHIRVTANRLGIKKQPFSVLTPDIVDRLNNMFQSDEAAFAAAQNEYTLENLRPDISKLVTSSATLASVRKWEDYRRLQAALAKDGIHV